MKYLIICFMFLIFVFQSCDIKILKKTEDNKVSFDSLISNFKKKNYLKNNVNPPFIFEETLKYFNYKAMLSPNPIFFDLIEKTANNPFRQKNPITYSVIYENRLVSLFDNGMFTCFLIPFMERDFELEKKLNTKKFQYQWILGKKLLAISDGKYYIFDSINNWIEYNESIPFKLQPKLFEDEKYIAFSTCFGEWGGLLYLYNKSTKKIHCIYIADANSIIINENCYYILSSSCLIPDSQLNIINNPELLKVIDSADVNKDILDDIQMQEIYYPNINQNFRFMFKILGFFKYQNKTIYLVNRTQTFLAEVENKTVNIINPLFNKDLEAEESLCTNYEKTVLINLLNNNYSAKDREFCCLIIQNNKIIKFMWN